WHPLCQLALLAMLTLPFLPAVVAQVSADIKGQVTDSSGAAIAGVTVSAKNLETGAVRTIITDDAGRYFVIALPIGEYEISAAKADFQDAIRGGIHLVVGQEANIYLQLRVSGLNSQITVQGDAPIVSTSTKDISGLVGEQTIKDIPLNGRRQ